MPQNRLNQLWESGDRMSLGLKRRFHAETGQSQRDSAIAIVAPTNCATINASTPVGAIPAKVSESARAKVTAGLANEVDAVNQ